ncbi:MAG: type II secretion system F family protein [Gammaproteobacteria bacterium]|nr:MAG: type II secretion system F family protein [Gammaproteobacteria bacterium]
MPKFEYYAIDKSGKRVVDVFEAPNRAEAFRKLTQAGLVVVRLREFKGKKRGVKGEESQLEVNPVVEDNRPFWQREIHLIPQKVSFKDLAILSKQLGALIEAGVGLVDALELVADSMDNPYLKKELVKIAYEIRGGENFSKTLKKRKKFDDFFVSMVEVGEETGQLDLVLKRSSEYYKRISEIINKVKSASFYPGFVFTAASLITFGIIYFLVPTFSQIYKSLGGELPAPTQMLINASNWLQHNILYFLGGIIGFVIVFVLLYKFISRFRWAIHWLLLKLPIFGQLFVKGALAKFSRTFATLFSAGVSIERALELSSKVSGNMVYQEALENIREGVVQGEPLWRAFEKTERFPRMLIAMLRIGEETGQLDNMLESLADFYEDEVKATIEGLISMIEPLMMVIIGSVVGFILIALYLPIFRMGELIH